MDQLACTSTDGAMAATNASDRAIQAPETAA